MSGYSRLEVRSFWVLYPERPGMKFQKQILSTDAGNLDRVNLQVSGVPSKRFSQTDSS
jgi:hypothetical protein